MMASSAGAKSAFSNSKAIASMSSSLDGLRVLVLSSWSLMVVVERDWHENARRDDTASRLREDRRAPVNNDLRGRADR